MRLFLLLALFCPYSSCQEEAEILVDLSICKDLNYCNFRGKCYNLGPDSDFFCLCFHGFTGDSCSEKDRTFHGVVGPCKFRNCQNGGLCYTTEEDPQSEEQCLCPPEFSGPYCSEKDE